MTTTITRPAPHTTITRARWDFSIELGVDGLSRSVYADGSWAPYTPLEAESAVAAARAKLAA